MTIKIDIAQQVRSLASAVGVLAIGTQGGYYLFCAADGDQLGHPETLYMPWTVGDVLEYCTILQEGMETGRYVV